MKARCRNAVKSVYNGAVPLAAILIMAGCATSKTAVLPNDLPKMKEVYEAHMRGIQGVEQERRKLEQQKEPAPGPEKGDDHPVSGGQSDGIREVSWVRMEQTALNTRFPRLPNPDIVIYIYPHLAGPERVPVPGYVTQVPLYDRIQYALPGEMAAEHRQ